MKNMTTAIAALAAIAVLPFFASCNEADGKDKSKASTEEAVEVVKNDLAESIILVAIDEDIEIFTLKPESVQIAIWNELNTEELDFEPNYQKYSFAGINLSGDLISQTRTGQYVLFTMKGGLVNTNNERAAEKIITSYNLAMFSEATEEAAAPPAQPTTPAPTATPEPKKAKGEPKETASTLSELGGKWASIVGSEE